jgi:hypothetical protein
MPPRDRIKRPEMPQYEIERPEPIIEDNSEGLSQDDLNEWLTQKIIRLELDTFRKEAREGRSPLQQRPSVQRIEPERLKPEVKKPKQQPYESMYGQTEEESEKAPKPKSDKNKKMIVLALILIIAGYLAYLGYQYFVLGYTLPGS